MVYCCCLLGSIRRERYHFSPFCDTLILYILTGQGKERHGMSKKELFKRYLLFTASLFFAALGVAITRHGELGVSPISSVANVMSYQFPSLSLGTWLILWNGVLIVGQVLMLRKEFQPIQLLQIPLSFLFGSFTDFGMWCVSWVPVDSYPVQLAMTLAGVVVLGFGVSLSVIANVIMNSGEAFVKALSDRMKKSFGSVKTGFDICCVLLSILLSLIFFDGSIVGTREGTILSALLTGMAVKFFQKKLQSPITQLLTAKAV